MRKVFEWVVAGIIIAGGAAVLAALVLGVHALVRWAGVAILRYVFHMHSLGRSSDVVWWVIAVVMLVVAVMGVSVLTDKKEVMSGEGGGGGVGISFGGGAPYSAGGRSKPMVSSKPRESSAKETVGPSPAPVQSASQAPEESKGQLSRESAAAPSATPQERPAAEPAAPVSASPSESSAPEIAPSGALTLEKPLAIKPPYKFRKDTFVRTDLSDLLDDLLGPDSAESAPAASQSAPAASEPEPGSIEIAEPLPQFEPSDLELPGLLHEQREPAQFVNFKILDAVDSDQRPLELHEGLYGGLDYKLVVSMGMIADPRFAAGEQEGIDRPAQEKVVLDVVLALEQNIEIRTECWATLEWPESGPSVKNAEFMLRPIGEGSARVKVLIYYDHDLLFCGDIEFEVRSEGDDWAVGDRPIRWKILDESKVGQLSPFRRFRDLDREARRGINISVHRRTPEVFDLVFFLRSSGPVPRAFPLRVEISELEIIGYLVRTRSALRLLTNVYEHPDGGDYSVDKFLDDMSLVGNELFNKLFGSETGQRLVSMLNEEFARPGTIVQVWTDTDALQFVLPWSWLYPLPVIAGKRQQTDIQQFWGYRYILEQLRQLTIDKRPASIVTGEPLRMAAAIHNFAAAAAQREFFIEFSSKYSARLAWAEVKAADWRRFLPKCDAHLLYFYCHGHTEQPLNPGDAEMLRTWQRLAIGSPAQIAAWIESLSAEQRKRVRGQSAIAIEKEILNMADLGQFKTANPSLNPVVFLNMCESSEYYPGATDNLVDVFLRRGARGVIGTEVPVLSTFGDTFARGFFEAFFTAGKTGEGNEIGTVLWQLRRSFLDQGNPLAFIYTYFGDATTRLKPAIIDSTISIEILA